MALTRFDLADRPPTPLSALRRFLRSVIADDLPDAAAAMAYYFMLSLFPSLILLVALIQSLPLDISIDSITQRIEEAVPGAAGEVLTSYLEEFAKEKASGVISLLGLVVLWAASKGIAGAHRSLNKVFGVRERRSAIRVRLTSIGMTLAFFLLLGLANVLLVLGPQAGQWMAEWVGLGERFAAAWSSLSGPLAILMLAMFILLALRFLPNRSVPFRFLLAGTVPTVLGLLGLAVGFRIWFSSFGDYDALYGSLASFILLLVFLWGASLLLLLGGEVAAHLAGVRDPAAPAKPRT